MTLLSQNAPETHAWLQAGASRLYRLAQLLDEFPSLHHEPSEDPLHQGLDPIIQTLCELNPLEMKLRLPAKAVLAESYWMLKSQHLKDVLAALSLLPAERIPGTLHQDLYREISRLIHRHLLAQLLIDIILNPEVAHPLKRAAASNLVDLWDQNSQQDTLSDFFQMIHSLWHARTRIRVQYGTLLGTAELLQLLEAECDPVVLTFFTEHPVDQEDACAFQEFLFGLSYEEILFLQEHMKEQGLSAIGQQEVDTLLAHHKEYIPLNGVTLMDPHYIYRSYKQRRSRARHRVESQSPGPHHTAEQLLVLYLLQQ